MSTSNLSQTAPLVAVSSLPPSRSPLSAALHHIKTLLMNALDWQPPAEQTDHPLPFFVTPIRFSWKSIYTPLEDWNGYR